MLRVLGIRQSVRGLVFAVHCFFFVILKLRIMGLSVLDCRTPYRWAIPFYIHTPLWKRSIKIYPLRIKDQKCRHVPPIRNCLNFLFPSEKRQFFSKPPEIFKRSKAPTQKWRSRTPSENLFHRGGVDIKWNGPLVDSMLLKWTYYIFVSWGFRQ